jgi:3-methyladenine DNA glycosylase/8-oxoguanine DNA glycosylase
VEDERPSAELWSEGVDLLSGDPAFGAIVSMSGPILERRDERTYFEALVRSIVFQQLAGKAAATIHRRFEETLGGVVEPETVLAADPEHLRSAGLSRNKLRAIEDLAIKVRDGVVCLDDLDGQSDDEVIERLTRVRGIGRWTAEMFLMFRLSRPDVWPVGDLGVRNGWARVHRQAALPSPDDLSVRGEPYRPWRSVLAWYCYRAVELLPPVDV